MEETETTQTPAQTETQTQPVAEPVAVAVAVPVAQTAPPAPDLSGLQAVVAAQQAAIDALTQQLRESAEAAQAAEKRSAEVARLQYVAGLSGGLVNESYLALAPTDADVSTEAGRQKLREWAGQNPSLFRGAGGGQSQPVARPTFGGRTMKTVAELLNG